jgi:hypothetical protein
MRPSALALTASALVLLACSAGETPKGIRLGSEAFVMNVQADTIPIPSQEYVRFKLFVRDRETKQPIQTGEGRIFASNKDGLKTYDGLAKGDEVGTYYATLFFAVSGDWAFAVEFRRDSTQRLQRDDWTMTIVPGKPGFER